MCNPNPMYDARPTKSKWNRHQTLRMTMTAVAMLVVLTTDSEYEPDSDCSEDDDSESVVELEGDELEQNLSGVRKELEELAKQTHGI